MRPHPTVCPSQHQLVEVQQAMRTLTGHAGALTYQARQNSSGQQEATRWLTAKRSWCPALLVVFPRTIRYRFRSCAFNP